MPRPFGVHKQSNEYAKALDPELYSSCPKAVFAAIAVSFATCGGDHMEKATNGIAREWHCLYNAGVVTQKPTVKDPGL